MTDLDIAAAERIGQPAPDRCRRASVRPGAGGPGTVTVRSNVAWAAASASACWRRRASTKTVVATPEGDRRDRHEEDECPGQSCPDTSGPAHAPRLACGLVARPADREDQLGRARIGLDLGTQPSDRDIDESRVAEVVVAPDPVEQACRGRAPARGAARGRRAGRTRSGSARSRPCCRRASRSVPATSITSGPRRSGASSAGAAAPSSRRGPTLDAGQPARARPARAPRTACERSRRRRPRARRRHRWCRRGP